MGKSKILIPSHKRSHILNKTVFANFPDYGKDDLFLFIGREQLESYRAVVGERATIVPTESQGIVKVRQEMHDWAVAQGIERGWTFHDDILKFKKRTEKYGNGFSKSINIGPKAVAKQLEETAMYIHDKGGIYVGIAPERIMWCMRDNPRGFYNSLPYGFVYTDFKWLADNNVRIPPELFRFEDTYVGLRVIEVSRSIAGVGIVSELGFSAYDTGYVGGCTDYMYPDAEKNRQAAEQFPWLFPNMNLKLKTREFNGFRNYSFGLNWKQPFREQMSQQKLIYEGTV